MSLRPEAAAVAMRVGAGAARAGARPGPPLKAPGHDPATLPKAPHDALGAPHDVLACTS